MFKNIQPDPDWLLYEDQDIVIINKPSGLLSVPGKSEANKTCVLTYLHQSHPDALIVHRLDMDTSGILVLARNKASHRHLSMQFQDRQVSKVYYALCAGQLEKTTGSINLPMRCDWDNRPKQIIDFIHGRHAQTDWQLLDQFNEYFSLALYPITGRSHQLRLHMQALGHPILGDNFYADTKSFMMTERLMLHAGRIIFTHPTTGENMKIDCPAAFLATTQ
jgi:tRNA pseudouridine32 synthase / 23S rRNA pseudouridine746 synthase